LGASDAGGRLGKRILTQHANNEDGVAGTDFVAVCESGFFDARAIEERAVAAVKVEKAAAFFGMLDCEVQSGHEFVVGESVIRLRGAADAERTAGDEREFGARVGAGAEFQNGFHVSLDEPANSTRLISLNGILLAHPLIFFRKILVRKTKRGPAAQTLYGLLAKSPAGSLCRLLGSVVQNERQAAEIP